MNFERAGVSNLINLNFNPDILTEEETKSSLEEAGLDISAIEQKFIQFEKKLSAMHMLETAEKKREDFEKNLESLKNQCSELSTNENESAYRMAARNKTGLSENDLKSDLLDIKMMGLLKKNGEK